VKKHCEKFIAKDIYLAIPDNTGAWNNTVCYHSYGIAECPATINSNLYNQKYKELI